MTRISLGENQGRRDSASSKVFSFHASVNELVLIITQLWGSGFLE